MKADIPLATRRLVLDRDRHRCRWCGVTNARLDLHHINYRSAGGDHSPSNLISLCRKHHELVHTNKNVYPELLFDLLREPGITGLQLSRRIAKK